MFSNDPEEPRLSDEAEELLANWPVPEKAPSDWEALAAAINQKIQLTEVGDTPDVLLEAPLPDALDQERAQGRRSHPRMKRPSEGSLVRLAQASVNATDDDPERDLLAHSLLSQAMRARSEARSVVRQRPPRKASTTVASERGAAAPTDIAAPTATDIAAPTATDIAAPTDIIASAGNHQPLAACPQPARNRLTRYERSMWFGVAFGALGMAAAAFMYVSQSSTPTAERVVAEASDSVPGAPEPAFEPLVTAAQAQAASPAFSIEDISPEADQLEAPQTATSHLRTVRVKVSGGDAEQAVATQSETKVAADDTGPPAAGPSETGMMMADSRGSNLPDKPSTGAVQVAIGSVMEAARACVVGQQASSRASVRFGSDGRVAAVNLSGPAAGTAAGRCVESALGGARLQPFSRPSFVVNLSVRPR
jgi:hypothetical protein